MVLDRIENGNIFEKFTNWIKLKFKIHSKLNNRPPFFMERDIWWCYLGQNIGDEENGKGEYFMRPVIIIRKYNKNLALVIPTSTKLKDNIFYHKINYKNTDYSALISHTKTIDVKRLEKKITSLPMNDFKMLKIVLQESIFGE